MKSLLFIFLLAFFCAVAEGLTREYIFINVGYPWQNAQSYCRQFYKDLATITTKEENNRLLQSGYYEYGSWIGLQGPNPPGTWTWSDGKPVSFQNWFSSVPDLRPQACVFTPYYSQNIWVADYCGNWRSFYCYRSLILVKEKKTWEEALDYCRINYTGLASVISTFSLQQLKLETVQTETESVWTGLHFVNGEWFWVSREPLGSLVSMPSCSAPSDHCGALNTTTDTLKNQNCNDRLNFICYWT